VLRAKTLHACSALQQQLLDHCGAPLPAHLLPRQKKPIGKALLNRSNLGTQGRKAVQRNPETVAAA
jgi:hypothetical protein